MTGFARIVTLGCRLNAADSALLYTALEECDYRASETETPDVLIVNTCAVTAEAERKTRQTLRRLRHEYPAARIIAAGCAADADREAMLRSGADLVCGNADKRDDYQRKNADKKRDASSKLSIYSKQSTNKNCFELLSYFFKLFSM